MKATQLLSVITGVIIGTSLGISVPLPASASCLYKPNTYCEQPANKVVVQVYGTAGYVNLRLEPNPNSEIRFYLSNGSTVTLLGVEENGYLLVGVQLEGYGYRQYWLHESYVAEE